MKQKPFPFQMLDDDSAPYQPERELIMAIFERALADVCSGWSIDQSVKREAAEWLRSESTEPYSANWWASWIDGEALLKQIRYLAKYKLYKRKIGRGWLRKENHTGDRPRS